MLEFLKLSTHTKAKCSFSTLWPLHHPCSYSSNNTEMDFQMLSLHSSDEFINHTSSQNCRLNSDNSFHKMFLSVVSLSLGKEDRKKT